MHTQQDERVRVLTDRFCERLLEHHTTGRLGYVEEDSVAIIPMNYFFHRKKIVMRTDESSKLISLSGTPVSFEIDNFDRWGEWGWSVLARGIASDVTDTSDEFAALAKDAPVWPMPPGKHERWIVIDVTETTGRCFGHPPEFHMI